MVFKNQERTFACRKYSVDKMSKPNFVDGICLNSDHIGLLSVVEDRLDELIKKEPITNVYNVEPSPFARGKFATVRKCSCPRGGGEFAAKFIRKRRRAADQRQDIVHEMAVLRLAAADSCARIVALRDVFETPAEMALVLEMASGGELQYVLDQEESLEENQVSRLMRQILEGLTFLHDHNIAHLDLKPQNLLLTGAYPNCDIKLCDFGISRVICNGVEVREILGTPDYVAPEVLNYEPISLATDIWSVGVLAYVLLTGYSPFGGDTKQETFCNITQGKLSFPEELFEGISSAARDFISATLVKNPRQRLSTQECLTHPWICGAFITPLSSDTRLMAVTRTDECEKDSSFSGEVKFKRCCSEIHFSEHIDLAESKGSTDDHSSYHPIDNTNSGEGKSVNKEKEVEITDDIGCKESKILCHECLRNNHNERENGLPQSSGEVQHLDFYNRIRVSECTDIVKQEDDSNEEEFNYKSANGAEDSQMELTNCNGTVENYEIFCSKKSIVFVHNGVTNSSIHSKAAEDSVDTLQDSDERRACERLNSESNDQRKDDFVDINLFVGLRNTVKACTKSVPGLNIEEEMSLRTTRELNGDLRNCDEIEIDEEGLPVKRSKNCCRRSSYPVSSCASCAQCREQCCHLHPTPSADVLNHIGRQHRLSTISNPPVEITVDRGITC